MFKNISYQKKLKALWVLGLIMLIICYKFSVAKTIDEYSEYKKNKELLSAAKSDLSTENLAQKNKMLDHVIEKFMLDTFDQAKNLVEVVTPLCTENNLTLKEYKPLPLSRSDSLKILTRALTLQGRFVDCVKLIYNLETASNAGRVSSVLFKSYTQPGTTKTDLNCTIYIQNIIP